jgi:cation diffusion facilitator family transporter
MPADHDRPAADAAPELTPAERLRVARLKERAAIVSVLASVVLTLGKAGAAWVSGSLALMSEAAHGIIDILATLTTWYAVRAAGRPADADHHYGHGKVEALAALGQTALLFSLAGAVGWEAVQRLVGTVAVAPVQVTPLVIGVLVAAILIDATRWRALHIIARQTGSQALAADAMHFASDLMSSALTLFGLILVLAGQPQGDTVAAIGISLFIAGAALRLGRRAIDTLVDTAPRGKTDEIEALIRDVPGVVAIESLKLRPSGAGLQGELSVSVSRALPLERVAGIKTELRAAITARHPDAEITISANPVAISDETVLEQVMLSGARLRIPVHHITTQTLGGRLCISLDMEVDGRIPLAEAHERATALEHEIRRDFGPETEVETHIEPMETREAAGRDAGWEQVERIGRLLHDTARAGGTVTDVHNVRVRITESGLVVNYHCRAPGSLDVETVHRAVDAIERTLREAHPEIGRVVGHAEPLLAEPSTLGTGA